MTVVVISIPGILLLQPFTLQLVPCYWFLNTLGYATMMKYSRLYDREQRTAQRLPVMSGT